MVVAAYGALIPAELLEERLWLNVHPSLLPRWRGAAPVERALMAGDAETGVTIHRTTAELDAGPIAAQRAFPIGPDDDAGAVYERAAVLAVELLDEVLPEPVFTPQPEEGATYAEKIGPPTASSTGRVPPASSRTGSGRSRRTSARAARSRARPVIVWRSARVSSTAGHRDPRGAAGGAEADDARTSSAAACGDSHAFASGRSSAGGTSSARFMALPARPVTDAAHLRG